MMNRNNVYLIPCGDRAYYSQVSVDSPSPSAIFIVAEGIYPAKVWWSRHDLNMCRLQATKTCASREELVELLSFLGECGHNIEELWDYNDRTSTNDAITKLFDVCYERKMEEINKAYEEVMAREPLRET